MDSCYQYTVSPDVFAQAKQSASALENMLLWKTAPWVFACCVPTLHQGFAGRFLVPILHTQGDLGLLFLKQQSLVPHSKQISRSEFPMWFAIQHGIHCSKWKIPLSINKPLGSPEAQLLQSTSYMYLHQICKAKYINPSTLRTQN